MGSKNGMLEIMRGLSYLTQVGLSVAAPIILCLLAARWLQNRFGWGSWVLITALLFGLISGLVSLWKFLMLVQKKASDKPRDSK